MAPYLTILSNGTELVDIVVIGDGPAGAVSALLLARAGFAVILVGRQEKRALGFCEIIPPSLSVWLHRLGVAESFVNDAHRPMPGVVATWGDSLPFENDYVFQPFGSGWIVDRSRFDATLVAAATAAGARIERPSATAIHLAASSERYCVQPVVNSEGPHSFCARLLIGANGKHRSIHPALSGRIHHDRLIAIGAVFEEWEDSPSADDRLYIEACEHGWWYSAPCPLGAGLLCVLMTDPDLISPAATSSFFDAALEQSDQTKARVGICERGGVRVVSAGTSLAVNIVHERFLAVGDAAFAFDPLWGHGVTRAIISGFRAAAACVAHFAGEASALEQYREDILDEYRDSIARLREYYSRESRWEDATFWCRRRKAVPAAV